MTTLAWKLNRLRSMSVPEVIWRARQSVSMHAGKIGIGLARNPPTPDVSVTGLPFVHTPSALVERGRVTAAADAVLVGQWSLFGLEPIPVGFPPSWNTDPRTSTTAPMAYGETIDYRDERVVGDIKYLWELGRHLELVALAQAWHLTGSERYSHGARALLDSWLDRCPYPRGVHWASSLELAIRLVNWSVAWQLFGGPDAAVFSGVDGGAFRERWLKSIYQHAHFIRNHLSGFSSAANHLFGELTGLYIAGTTWPYWTQMREWRMGAKRRLEQESLAQNTSDGVNREQAIYYQNEVMEMMLLCLLASRAQGEDFSPEFSDRLEKLAEFLHAVMDVAGHVPMLGDADDGTMLRLSHAPVTDPYSSLLASCALLFGRSDFKHKAVTLDDKTRWLFGERVESRWAALPSTVATPRLSFPEGGHFLLGSAFDEPREVRLAIDCAAIGYLSIAAHGHADALAFTLSVGGYELLIDPGTYAYHTHRPWRDYFRGTLAHNTVRVDGHDQSVSGGPFMWLDKARARLLRHDPRSAPQKFTGEHDGYMRLADPVLHRRQLLYHSASGDILVTDRLECRATHAIEVAWHWAENAEVALDGDGVTCSHGLARARMSCETPGFVVGLHRGQETPILGWVSRRFERKVPTTTTVWRGRITGSTEIVTRIRAGLKPAASTSTGQGHQSP
jgi:hypothetical protein